MKKLIFLATSLVLISIAYYFAIVLPQKYNLEMQERCAKSAEKFVKGQDWAGDTVDYECHFNKRLNKCFVRIKSSNMASKAIAFSLVDVLENKNYGLCLEVESKVSPFGCWIESQKDSKSLFLNEWVDASKKYMNE